MFFIYPATAPVRSLQNPLLKTIFFCYSRSTSAQRSTLCFQGTRFSRAWSRTSCTTLTIWKFATKSTLSSLYFNLIQSHWVKLTRKRCFFQHPHNPHPRYLLASPHPAPPLTKNIWILWSIITGILVYVVSCVQEIEDEMLVLFSTTGFRVKLSITYFIKVCLRNQPSLKNFYIKLFWLSV